MSGRLWLALGKTCAGRFRGGRPFRRGFNRQPPTAGERIYYELPVMKKAHVHQMSSASVAVSVMIWA